MHKYVHVNKECIVMYLIAHKKLACCDVLDLVFCDFSDSTSWALMGWA